jgi:hypothetical protein
LISHRDQFAGSILVTVRREELDFELDSQVPVSE